MPLDVDRLRAETPGTRHVAHFNNAGASLPPQPVIDAVGDYYSAEVRYGGYETADDRAAQLQGTYDAVAGLIGASRSEVAVVDSATRAWDQVFGALALRLAEGDRILTTTSEYAANYIAYLQARKRSGVVVDVVPDAPTGEIDVGELAGRIDDRVKLVSLNHVPTHNGLVNPAAAVGRVAREAGVPFLLDACQSVGQLPLDVGEIGCDFLVATSRKFLRGPRGMGFLYVASPWLEHLEPVTLDLHGARWVDGDAYEMRPDARRFELWEQNAAAKVGMRAAIEYATAVGIAVTWARLRDLAAGLRSRLRDLAGVTVKDRGAVQGGIVTFTVAGCSPHEVQGRLREQRINVSTSSVWSARHDMARSAPDGVVRASVHYFNSDDEIERLVGAIAAL